MVGDRNRILTARFMVRTKARARRVLIPLSDPSNCSESSPSSNPEIIELYWCRMAKKKKQSGPLVTQLFVHEPPRGGVLSTPDGYWSDTSYFFVKKDPAIEEEFYYRDFSICYRSRQEFGHPGPYNESEFDAAFSKMGISEAPYPLKEKFASLPDTQMDKLVRAAFHLGSEISWRWPQPGERIYHRPANGYVGVWLETLRSGWNPRCHQFIKHLCKYVYKISIMQITPNGVKWMTWFLSSCNKMGYQPTLRLFHQLFKLVQSNKEPLYEIRFRAEECGYPSGTAKPVIQQSTLKYWSGELIFLKGLDLEFLPYIVSGVEAEVFDTYTLEGEALAQIHRFCECLGFQMTRDSFMKHDKLFELGCLPYFKSDLYDIMSSNALAASFKKLGGVHSTKSSGDVGGSGSSALKEGGAESVAPNAHQPEPVVDAADIDIIDDLELRSSKKRKIHVGRKPPAKAKVTVDKIVADDDGKGPDKEPIRIGNFTLEELAGMCADIPIDTDFEEMEKSGSNACLKRLVGYWGHTGSLISALASVIVTERKSAQEFGNQKDARLRDLELEVASLKTKNAEKEFEFTSKLSGLQVEILVIEKKANDLDEVNKQLLLENVKSREAVIAEFKGGPEYDQDVADAAAPEILRAWLVSERHVKTDLKANWDSFVVEFLAAKLALEQGKGEPQPYDGPVPSFLPSASNPVLPTPDDHADP
ncbi:hypothetical protein POM88_040997 [Heracleum sosnowskyi]|uniref:Transposase (putative) gypsy type domain-containing protein n=1 Tax=Heracleum sosnowskyi TaxID=360622 RepID=A0AAD8HE74_9APIA|nr:hypothetical protein POM88_040997 [Heracleum sosnowskyi]